MYAKIKSTGDIVEVKSYSKDNYEIRYSGCEDRFGEYSRKRLDEVELLLDDVNQEQRRYEIAKEAMGAFIASPSYQFCVNNNYYDASYSRPRNVAEDAVEYAEALIEELKKDKREPRKRGFQD